MTESDSPGIGGSGGHILRTGRRLRHWPADVKQRMVEETFAPGASVSLVARRHDVNANLLFEWRKKYREGGLRPGKVAARSGLPGPELIRIGVIDPNGDMRPLPAAGGSSAPSQPCRTRFDGATAWREGPAVPAPMPAGVVEIEWRSGIKVRVDAGIDEGTLRRVLSAVKALA